MKKILCYGDSNTWGFDAGSFESHSFHYNRYTFAQRWPGVVQNILGNRAHITEEALCGRTTQLDDPDSAGRNGLTYLLPCLHSHKPIDIVALMLGTNDCKDIFQQSAQQIADGMRHLIELIQDLPNQKGGFAAPDILLIAPAVIKQNSFWGGAFKQGYQTSYALSDLYRKLADEYGLVFYDANEVASVCDLDGVHLDVSAHQKLGTAIASVLNHMVSPIELVTHDSSWQRQFNEEAVILQRALGTNANHIHHIGSTAIPGIVAKPVIDMLVEVEQLDDVDQQTSQMQLQGYQALGECQISGRRFFCKDVAGQRKFHVHVFAKGDPQLQRHLAFRDYLISHPKDAQRYSELKQSLVAQHPKDIQKYLAAKKVLIDEIDAKAKVDSVDA